MRTPSISSAYYSPDIPPEDVAFLRHFVFDELQKISSAIVALSLGHLDKTCVAPTKPRDGDVRYADGTNWNPGAGAGIYWFNGTVWTKM